MNTEAIFTELPILESKNITLKKIEAADLKELFAIYDNDKVFKYCGIIPKHNIKTVEKMIGHFERDFNKQSRVKWGIFAKEHHNKLVGIIEAMDFKQKMNMVTIGYYLAEEYWGDGIATESVNILVEFLLDAVDVNRIHAEVMLDNLASKRVLEKNGFIKEGLIRQANFWPGKGVVDIEIYGLLAQDYNK